MAFINYDKNKQDGACTTQMLNRKNIATKWIINEKNSNTVKAADRNNILICTQTRLYSNKEK